MKSFARNRKNRRNDGLDPDATDGLLDVDELDIAPLGVGTDAPATSAPEDPNANEAADFSARLGDLDRFIGGGNSIGGSGVAAPTAPVSWSSGVARNLPAAPIPSVAPISHPRPTPVDRAPEPEHAVERPVADPEAEAQEFVDRLGDLDRFIGGGNSMGGAPSPTPAASAPAGAPVADPEAEAQDFLDRLSDLDRFIGGGQNPPTS